MDGWMLVLVLVLISIPGILVTAPAQGRIIAKMVAPKLPAGRELPSPSVLGFGIGMEALVLLAIFAFLGGRVVDQIGLSAPFFEALIKGENYLEAAAVQILPMLFGGILGGLVFVTGYYTIFRPRLDLETVRNMESFRMQLGLAGRLLYGGIYEEVLTRWGLMSIFAWFGLKLFGTLTPLVMWAAITISGILFGILHIPNYVLAGSRLSPMFISLMIFLNLWASLVFGWLFWEHGLLAAIGAHMLFHLVWYPFDVWSSKKEQIAWPTL